MSDVKKILDEAADLLIDKGWIQGQSRNSNGFCAMGAISYVASNKFNGRGASEATMTLGQLLDRNIATWNDTKGRKLDEVVDKLREAAKSVS